MMKTLLGLAAVVVMAGCATQPPPSGVALAPQSTPAPLYSALDQPSIVPIAHQLYHNQRNTLEGVATGAVYGAGVGQVAGQNTRSTAYGAAAGALIGYGAY